MSSSSDGRRRRGSNELFESLGDVAAGVGRLGYGLASFGLGLLPGQSRQHMHNALHELSHAFVRLPADFTDVARVEIDRWATDAELADEGGSGRRTVTVETTSREATLGDVAGEGLTLTVAAEAEVKTTEVASPTGIGITYIEFDPPGRDIDGEYVLIRNGSAAPANLAGWVLRDGGARHTYTFPAFTLAPGAEVKLWTRSGKDDGANLFWGNNRAIWNNTGDSATLSDAAGTLVGRYAYEGKKS